MPGRMRRVVAVGSVALWLAAAGCGTDDPTVPSTEGEQEGEQAPPGGPREWVAVFDTAADPEDLVRVQTRVLRRAPRNVLVGPAACHRDLARELSVDEGHYVAGVVAPSRAELRGAVEAVGQEPVFQGRLALLCGV